MSNNKPDMTAEDRKFLDTANPSAIEERCYNGASNPSSTDWMLRISKLQKDGTAITEEDLKEKLQSLGAVTFYAFQLEKGSKNGYLHYQLFFQRSSRTRLSTILRVFNPIHVPYCVPRKWSTASCIDYCTKEDTRQSNPVTWGVAKIASTDPKITLDDLINWISSGDATLDDLLNSDNPEVVKAATVHAAKLQRLEASVINRRYSTIPRDVEVFYLWGPTRTGKTTLAKKRAGDSCYTVTSYAHPFDGYNYQRALLLDDWRDSRIDLVQMLHILDSQPMQLSCRYYDKQAAWEKVFITSNVPPEALYLDADAASRDALLARITEVWHVEEDSVKVYETPQHLKTKHYEYQDKRFEPLEEDDEWQ